jgi:ABC-type uncharacterized transport system auxiliary subunit
MRKKMFLFALVCACTLSIPGCGGVKYPSYYTLSIAPALKPEVSRKHLPVTVAVQQFEIPEYLRQGRIVYSKAPGDIGFYEYHRWAADPGALVTTAIVDSLRSDPLFPTAAPYQGSRSADYLLSGRLEKLEEVDYGAGVTVEAKLSAELMNLRTGSIVWSGNAAESSRVEGRDVNAVVAGMSRALESSIDRLLTEMEHQVART